MGEVGLFEDRVRHLFLNCASARAGEQVLILHDAPRAELATACVRLSPAELGLFTGSMALPTMNQHGMEPPPEVAAAMLEADVIICMAEYSLAHSQARHAATSHRSRFLSLPGFDEEILLDDAFGIDFRERAGIARGTADFLEAGGEFHLSTALGTDLLIRAEGRRANACPGYVENTGELGSPPDVEANIAPLETRSQGIVVVDASITHKTLGVVTRPVTLTIREGLISRIEGHDVLFTNAVRRLFDGQDERRRVLAELGIGLNPKARITGNILLDEGAMGYVHLGFGSNATIGGQNCVPFHLDFVISKPTLASRGRVLLAAGEFA